MLLYDIFAILAYYYKSSLADLAANLKWVNVLGKMEQKYNRDLGKTEKETDLQVCPPVEDVDECLAVDDERPVLPAAAAAAVAAPHGRHGRGHLAELLGGRDDGA